MCSADESLDSYVRGVARASIKSTEWSTVGYEPFLLDEVVGQDLRHVVPTSLPPDERLIEHESQLDLTQ